MTKKDPADEDDGRPKPLYPEPGVEEWELERALTHDGATYLVDRYNGSNIAYDDSGEWPVSVGKLVEDSDRLNRMFDSVSKPMIRIVRSTGTRDAGAIFDEIDRMLKDERRRLRDVFDEYDRNKDGILTRRELGDSSGQPFPMRPFLRFDILASCVTSRVKAASASMGSSKQSESPWTRR